MVRRKIKRKRKVNRKVRKKVKWGTIGAPHSDKRKRHMASIRKKRK